MLVIFSHGKESGPQGRKIAALAHVAHAEGAQTMSIDYREDPPGVPHNHDAPGEAERRVEQLLATPLPPHDGLVLVGSSMGGHVSAVAATRMRPRGLFLIAPALSMPGYRPVEPQRLAPHVTIVHGRQDEVIPWAHSFQWAELSGSALQLVDGDHRLDSAIPKLEMFFKDFLRACAS